MRRLIPFVCALCLVAAWVAPGAAYDHIRFMGRDFPRPGSAAFRARAARLASLGARGAEAARPRALGTRAARSPAGAAPSE